MKDPKDEQSKDARPPTTAPGQPLASTQAVSATAVPTKESDKQAEAAFSSMAHGKAQWNQLSESAKDAFRALARIDKSHDKYESAKRAAEDAIRDHERAGIVSAPPNPHAGSTNPEDVNQRPTGTQGQGSGPPDH